MLIQLIIAFHFMINQLIVFPRKSLPIGYLTPN